MDNITSQFNVEGSAFLHLIPTHIVVMLITNYTYIYVSCREQMLPQTFEFFPHIMNVK